MWTSLEVVGKDESAVNGRKNLCSESGRDLCRGVCDLVQSNLIDGWERRRNVIAELRVALRALSAPF